MGIGIVGTGWGARVQVPAFRHAGLRVVGLAGSDAAKTRRIADELQVEVGVGDWRLLLERDDITLISVVTPPDLHEEIAVAALAAGKHVLCEKPTALNAGQAQSMADAAVRHPNLLALIDHELRFHPALVLGRQMIAEGAIGELRYARGVFNGAARADRSRAWNWWSDAARGGGALGAIGSHQIDTLRYLVGDRVQAVAGTINTFITERPSGEELRAVTSDDFYSLRLRLAGPAFATIEGCAVTRIDEPTNLTLYGSEGTLRWSGGRLEYAEPGEKLRDITPEHRYEPLEGLQGEFPHATLYLAHALRRFFDGDQAALSPAATFADGLRIQRILDAARSSHASGGGFIELAG